MLSLEVIPPARTLRFKGILSRKVHHSRLSFCSIQFTKLRFCAVHCPIRTGFSGHTLKSFEKDGNRLLEMESGFDDEFGGDGEDDEDDEVVMPLRNMKDWLENKPRGFGEDKVYDTSIEEELLQEIEQSRQAQLANINKLKSNPQKPKSKKEEAVDKKTAEDVQNGFRVRLVNLPKKKNIDKDLKLAFKEVPGIVNIIPVVSRNKKTRDPICKGFAFVDFKSVDDADRFVQAFSKASVNFGKIQKKIKCEMMDASFSTAASEQSVDEANYAHQLEVSCVEGDLASESGVIDHSSEGRSESDAGEYENSNNECISAQCDNEKEDLEISTSFEDSVDFFSSIPGEESTINLLSSKHEEKAQEKGRKPPTKKRKEKIPKLSSSSRRLRVKEKAVLNHVFSKYVAKTALASREHN